MNTEIPIENNKIYKFDSYLPIIELITEILYYGII